jgi:hypothetical protein
VTVVDSREASRLARGVCRTLYALGYGVLTEFTLRNGRRADVIGVNGAGEIAIVEIKTSEADFRADQKWPEYLPFCDSFFFAVPEGFPRLILPEGCGLMVADSYESAILRPSPALAPLSAARRRALILSFAIAASARLQRALDPEAAL